LSKSCQKVVKILSKSCQTVVKKLSKSCHKKLSPSDKHSNPKLEKPENLKEEATKNQRMMKKHGIRRLDATSSHLVKRQDTEISKTYFVQWPRRSFFSQRCQQERTMRILIPHLLKFSNWEKLIRIVAYCRRMVSRKKGDISPLEKWKQNKRWDFITKEHHFEQLYSN
jgi:hypothetical protein